MALAVLAVAATGACSNGDDDDDSAEEPRPPEFTATTLDRTSGETDAETATTDDDGDSDGGREAEASPEQVVEATYEAFWERREHAIKFPDTDYSDLTEVASGAALDELTSTLAHLEQVGQQGEFGALDAHHVYEVELAGVTSATVSDCALSDARVVVAATGEVVRTDPPDGAPFIYTATMVQGGDGLWRVDSLSRVPLMGDRVCTGDGPVGQGS
jgi:hypothetical protein